MSNSAGRKSISKTLRFEVFKRDMFKCQYCGSGAPDVLLHVDHIRPVAEGGETIITNLVTACVACNLGKGARPLDVNTTVEKARKQMEELQERREQLEMIMEWQRGLTDLEGTTLDEIAGYWRKELRPYLLNEAGRKDLRKLIARYGASEVMNAIRKGIQAYIERDKDGDPTHESVEIAFSKIGGICRVTREAQKDPDLPELYYTRGILRKRISERYYYNDAQAIQFLKAARSWGATLEELRDLVFEVRNWKQFSEGIDDLIERCKEEGRR